MENFLAPQGLLSVSRLRVDVGVADVGAVVEAEVDVEVEVGVDADIGVTVITVGVLNEETSLMHGTLLVY